MQITLHNVRAMCSVTSLGQAAITLSSKESDTLKDKCMLKPQEQL